MGRAPSQRDLENQFLDQKIIEIYQFHQGRYGGFRIWQELLMAGIRCSLNRVKRRLTGLNLKAKTKRRFKATTDSAHQYPVAPNLLNRDFTTTAPNQK
ncbi:IS3 family transposase [Candidiatus Paracoxiella cheracis]